MAGKGPRHPQPGDSIYVLQLQQIGTSFYGPRYGLLPSEWGGCHENEPRSYTKDVDRYRGVRRLCVLSGSGRLLRPIHAAVRHYLGTIGVKTDSLSLPSLTLGSVSIELYDLSDPTRLRVATADSFPMPPMPADPRPGCRGGTRANFGSPLTSTSAFKLLSVRRCNSTAQTEVEPSTHFGVSSFTR
jgi:hypothetical protein